MTFAEHLLRAWDSGQEDDDTRWGKDQGYRQRMPCGQALGCPLGEAQVPGGERAPQGCCTRISTMNRPHGRDSEMEPLGGENLMWSHWDHRHPGTWATLIRCREGSYQGPVDATAAHRTSGSPEPKPDKLSSVNQLVPGFCYTDRKWVKIPDF